MAYKDSLFRSIFGNEKSALHLYNALHGTSYTEGDTEVVINTLEETLWTWRKNDVSFLVNDCLVVVAEHQSTINENMPFRCLQYICRLFENGIRDKDAVYRRNTIMHPRPRFIVFFNGLDAFPDRRQMRLSHAFKPVSGFEDVNLELVVDVYNINDGRNRDILDACTELKGYAFFVARVRLHEAEFTGQGMDSESITVKAIKMAIQDCKDAGYLEGYLENLTTEEIHMLSMEWDWDTALEVREEEGWERGRIEGHEKGRVEGRMEGRVEGRIEGRVEGRTEGRTEGHNELLALLDKGYTAEDIRRELSLQAEISD